MTPQEHAHAAVKTHTPVAIAPVSMIDDVSPLGRDGAGGEVYRATELHIGELTRRIWWMGADCTLAGAVQEAMR